MPCSIALCDHVKMYLFFLCLILSWGGTTSGDATDIILYSLFGDDQHWFLFGHIPRNGIFESQSIKMFTFIRYCQRVFFNVFVPIYIPELWEFWLLRILLNTWYCLSSSLRHSRRCAVVLPLSSLECMLLYLVILCTIPCLYGAERGELTKSRETFWSWIIHLHQLNLTFFVKTKYYWCAYLIRWLYRSSKINCRKC